MYLICSIGPQIKSNNDISKLIESGMNVMRFNGSHINFDKSQQFLKHVRTNHPKIKVLLDLQGKKIRVSKVFRGEKRIHLGEKVIFCDEKIYNAMINKALYKENTIIPIHYDDIFERILSAEEISMKDGTMKFGITKREKDFLDTQVLQGGVVRAGKGVNAPGMKEGTSHNLTDKDKQDILWGLENNVDIICGSFVNKKEDSEELKSFILNNISDSKNPPQIWSKIETKLGYENFDSILSFSDGIILGRGDLTAEIGRENVPFVQNAILHTMKTSLKDLVIATYVLDSMKRSSYPSVAEVSDIYNSLQKGVSGFMLCGEVGVGRFPFKTTKFLKEMYQKFA